MVMSFRDAASQAVQGALCATLAVGDNVYRLFDWGLDPQGRGNVAAGVRRLLCNIDPSQDTLPAPPPFTGGQCPGTSYGVSATWTRVSGGVVDTGGSSSPNCFFPTRGPGPISIVNNSTTGSGGVEALIVFGNGNQISVASTSDPSGSVVINQVFTVVCNGGPDDCGDPDPVYPDPEPVVGPTTNITYNIDESTEITVPLTVVFAPIFVKATGQFSFPIRLDIGGVTFSGTFDVSPTINLNIYPDGSGGGNGGGTDEPDDDIPPIDVPNEDETPEFDNRIIGVFIRSNINPNIVRATGIPAGENLPEIWAPRLANCKFLIRAGETTGWTEDIDVKSANQYIPCPHPGGAVDVRVFPQQGVTVAVEPHRAVPLLPDLPPAEE